MDALITASTSNSSRIFFNQTGSVFMISSKSCTSLSEIRGSRISLMVRPYNRESFRSVSRSGIAAPVSHFETACLDMCIFFDSYSFVYPCSLLSRCRYRDMRFVFM